MSCVSGFDGMQKGDLRIDIKPKETGCLAYYTPEGIALSYLFTGTPITYVVGNLWDITDRDVDGYVFWMLKNRY